MRMLVSKYSNFFLSDNLSVLLSFLFNSICKLLEESPASVKGISVLRTNTFLTDIPFLISRYLCIILIIILKYSIGQIAIKCDTLRNSNVIYCVVVRVLLHGDIANTSVDSKQSR